MFQAPQGRVIRRRLQLITVYTVPIRFTGEKEKPENELHQMAGEQASTAMISRLQKAESMEGGSPEEIWKGTG